jgi:hypothetical protein
LAARAAIAALIAVSASWPLVNACAVLAARAAIAALIAVSIAVSASWPLVNACAVLAARAGAWATSTPTMDTCPPKPERSSSKILAFAPPASTAATAANTAVVSSIRVLVMSYMPRLLLDRSTMWRA